MKLLALNLFAMITVKAALTYSYETDLSCNFIVSNWFYSNQNMIVCFVTNLEVFNGSHVHVKYLQNFGQKNGFIIYEAPDISKFPSFSTNVNVQSLKLIQVFDSKLREINRADLRRFPELTILLLSYNLISTIEDGTFSSNRKLSTIDLSGNLIMTIAPTAFNILPLLGNLKLSENLCNSVYDAFGRDNTVKLIMKVKRGACVPIEDTGSNFSWVELQNEQGNEFGGRELALCKQNLFKVITSNRNLTEEKINCEERVGDLTEKVKKMQNVEALLKSAQNILNNEEN